ncbi:nuclear valosin-containing protein-like isoform X1 [Macrosteles quadrilineatus]|uniref:nuclear valosin-containing protein-like isoform X1 n=1 Tax=Macrosteles quadrilineatus TaxID=74068 RepID=UPI0023E1185E|nr:nuclear valosin-containing protein-like isoform X1 [Macrosteles quadrilineatus]
MNRYPFNNSGRGLLPTPKVKKAFSPQVPQPSPNNQNNPYSIMSNNGGRESYYNRPYFSDPLTLSRVSMYLQNNGKRGKIDFDHMVDQLQREHHEYRRKKRWAFKNHLKKAVEVISLENSLNQDDSDLIEDDDDIETSDPKGRSSPSYAFEGDGDVNSTLEDSYLQQSAKRSRKVSNSSPAQELISIVTSDEDNNEEEAATKAAPQNCTNATPNTPTCKNVKVETTPAPKVTVPEPVTQTKKRKTQSSLVDSKRFKASLEPVRPTVSFKDIGGTKKVLQEVTQMLIHMRHPEVYRVLGVSPPRGFLLHGPPGSGKTLLANAIAGELTLPLLKVAAPELVGGLSGQSEERIRELFEQALALAPCILFIDEVDAITPNRETAHREMERRIVAQLLSSMDELAGNQQGDQVLVIGATNRPDSLDPALRRAGRFDREVCLGIPDRESRESILQTLCHTLKLAPEVALADVAMMTPGYVGADLKALVTEAAMAAVNRLFKSLQEPNPKDTPDTKDGSTEVKSSNGCVEHSTPMEVDDKSKTDQVDVEVVEWVKEADQPETSKDGQNDEACESEKKGEESVIEVVEIENDVEVVKDQSDIDVVKDQSDIDVVKDQSDIDVVKDQSDIDVVKDQSDIDVVKVDSKVEEDGGEKENVHSQEQETEPLCPPSLLHSAPLSVEQLQGVNITMEDFKAALKAVQPSAKREGFATVPDVRWEDIGSLKDIRHELEMAILAPVKFPAEFAKMGLDTPTGVLLCGPPGCGKTLLAKAVANEAGINFISVKGPELLNMYVGESERAVRQCFQRARSSQPCVIFFDEIDALAPKRMNMENGASRVVNQLLTEMDGVEARNGVFLMAATNRPDIVDPAVMRPGRLDKVLYVGLPGAEDRVDILRALTKGGKQPVLAEDVSLADVARDCQCEGYTGADLAALVREASLQALKEYMASTEPSKNDLRVCKRHFTTALSKIRPSVSEKDKKRYEDLRLQYAAVPVIK